MDRRPTNWQWFGLGLSAFCGALAVALFGWGGLALVVAAMLAGALSMWD